MIIKLLKGGGKLTSPPLFRIILEVSRQLIEVVCYETYDRREGENMAPALVLLAGVLWGIIGLFVRSLNAYGLTSMEIVAVRAIVTALLLFCYLIVFNRKLLKIKIKDIWCFLGTGVLSIVFFNTCYFKAITLTSLSVAAVLLYTAPAIVMVLSAVLFREKITVVKLISLLATFAGCVLITGVLNETSSLSMAGILAGLGAGLGYALYSIFSRYALERGYHSLTISFYTFLFAMVVTIPLANMQTIASRVDITADRVGFCVLFGLVSTVIPYIVYTLGLSKMENGKAAIIASIEPVTATVLGVILYGERLKATELLGGMLVLFAIIICNIPKRKAHKSRRANGVG